MAQSVQAADFTASTTATGSGTNLVAGNTYLLQIFLADGTIIGTSGTNGTIPSAPYASIVGYQFGLK